MRKEFLKRKITRNGVTAKVIIQFNCKKNSKKQAKIA
jgi:hypothetical protein